MSNINNKIQIIIDKTKPLVAPFVIIFLSICLISSITISLMSEIRRSAVEEENISLSMDKEKLTTEIEELIRERELLGKELWYKEKDLDRLQSELDFLRDDVLLLLREKDDESDVPSEDKSIIEEQVEEIEQPQKKRGISLNPMKWFKKKSEGEVK